jgi:hypothetical protein
MAVKMDQHDLAFFWQLECPSLIRRADDGCQAGFRRREGEGTVKVGRDDHTGRRANDHLLERCRPQLEAADDLRGDLLEAQMAQLPGRGATDLGESRSLGNYDAFLTSRCCHQDGETLGGGHSRTDRDTGAQEGQHSAPLPVQELGELCGDLGIGHHFQETPIFRAIIGRSNQRSG